MIPNFEIQELPVNQTRGSLPKESICCFHDVPIPVRQQICFYFVLSFVAVVWWVFFLQYTRDDVGLTIFKHVEGIPPEEDRMASLFVKLNGVFCCRCSHYLITLLFVEFHWKLTSREHLEREVRDPGKWFINGAPSKALLLSQQHIPTSQAHPQHTHGRTGSFVGSENRCQSQVTVISLLLFGSLISH